MKENKLVMVENNEVTLNKSSIDMNQLVVFENGKPKFPIEVKNFYIKLKKLQLEIDLFEKELKVQTKAILESTGEEKIIQDGISARIRAGYTTKRFDSTRFKKECPEIYEEYSKDSSVSSSITIDVE